MKYILHFILFLSLSCLSCESNSMPKERPVDLVVRLTEGGGMVNVGEEIYLSADSGRIEKWEDQARSVFSIPMTDAVMDSIYKIFRDHNVFSIQPKDEGIVHDRGGINVYFSYGGNNLEISNSGSMFIKEGDRDRYDVMIKAIYAPATKVLKENEFLVNVDAEIVEFDSLLKKVKIQMDYIHLILEENQGGIASIKGNASKNFLKGSHMIHWWLQKGGENVSGSQKIDVDGNMSIHLKFYRDSVAVLAD